MFVCSECGATQAVQGRCPADGTELSLIGEDLLLGTTIGAYRVARLLGIGGMGRVYKGVHPGIGSRVAIKVLSRECSDRRDLVERFFSEARAVNLIRHESIVNVLDLAMLGDGRPYIIMEYLDGAPLATLIETAVYRQQALPLGGVARLAAEVLDALGAAHAKNIVHRDLKPDNIYVTPSGRPKVLDFGIAKLTDQGASSATATGSLLGTPHYMSPEQASGRPVDLRADLYAMGIILFECATGSKPFQADSLFELLRKHVEAPPPSPRALRHDLPPELEHVILTALAKAPEQRFASAQAMSVALQHATSRLPPEQWIPLSPSTAPKTNPGAWAPTAPASWAGSATARESPIGHHSTVSASSGQLAPAPTAKSSSKKGVWLAVGALVLVGGGVTAAVVAGGGGGSAAQPAAALGDPPADPTGSADPPSPEAADEPPEAVQVAETPPPAPTAPTGSDPKIKAAQELLARQIATLPKDKQKAFEKLKHLDKLSDEDKLEALDDLSDQLSELMDADLDKLDKLAELPGVLDVVTPGGAGGAPSPTKLASGAWVSADDLAFADFDPKHVDVARLIAFAMREAKRVVPDAELFRIDANGVGPDGFANLTYASHASDHGSIDFRFRSPSRSKRDPSLPLGVKQEWKCEFRIEAEPDGVHIRPVNGFDCGKEKPVPAPRCSPAALWKKAIAKKAPTNAIANLGYRAGKWYFDIGSGFDVSFSQVFGDDC